MKMYEGMGDAELSKFWEMMDWDNAERNLLGMQRNIALAVFRRDDALRVECQKTLVRSIYAKILAVRHVCDSVTMAGVDKVKWTDPADKMRAAFSLTSKDYHAKPMRMLVIQPKGSTKERHIQIPTSYDRAMQTLYAYSLDPVSEATGERKSFAFRKGRSMQDVHAYIMDAVRGATPPQFIVKADIKSYYASIGHEWLLRNIPMDTRVLQEFLKAGYVYAGELFPPDDYGISLGSSISPILGNMVLDGMQKVVFQGLHGATEDIDFANGNLIRFADDVIITARTREDAVKILKILEVFLSERGCRLSPEKTAVYDLNDGFDFLSRNYKRETNGVVLSSPSAAAIKKLETSLQELIPSCRGGQKSLIDKLNKKLNGWAVYHKVTEAQAAFRYIDVLVDTMLIQLCERLHPNLPRKKILEKYFYKEPDGTYVYALPDKSDVRVVTLAKTVLTEHRAVKTKVNPYLDGDYYEARTDERAIANVTGKYKAIWERQNGHCHYCGKPILADQHKTTVLIDASLRESARNSAYVHAHCSLGQAEYYRPDGYYDLHIDLIEILEKMNSEEKRHHIRQTGTKFSPLAEYFRKKTEPVFTLSFDEIDAILGKPLCGTARKHQFYWYQGGVERISDCWVANAYKIRRLDMQGARVIFAKDNVVSVPVTIPEIFKSGRVPPNARAELENFFGYIQKKYGL
jgi:RNA-directed DNA polymerase